MYASVVFLFFPDWVLYGLVLGTYLAEEVAESDLLPVVCSFVVDKNNCLSGSFSLRTFLYFCPPSVALLGQRNYTFTTLSLSSYPVPPLRYSQKSWQSSLYVPSSAFPP